MRGIPPGRPRAVSALTGTLVGRRAAEPRNRGHWTLWSVAAGCWLAGQLGWDAFTIASPTSVPTSPNVADFCWWAFAILMILSLVRMRSRSRALLIVGAAEVLPLIAAAASLTYALLWHDAGASTLPVAQRLSALVYPALYVSAAVLALQALIGGALTSVRSAAARVVLAGVMLEAAAFIPWSQQLLDQSYVSGHSVLDPIWVLGLVTIGIGGALAARRARAGDQHRGAGVARRDPARGAVPRAAGDAAPRAPRARARRRSRSSCTRDSGSAGPRWSCAAPCSSAACAGC